MTTAATTSRSGIVLSESAYIRAICFFTMIMTGIVALGSATSYHWAFSWWLLGFCFAAAIIGIIAFQASTVALISFIGVSILSGSLGLMMGPAIALYSAASIAEAGILAAMAMVVMSLLGITFPATFRGWGSFLMAGLTLLIVASFAQIIFESLGFTAAAHMPALIWLGIVIFLGYVAYDWSQAIELEHTWDNAIDASGSLILDAVNLFLRILQLVGDSSSSSD